MMDRIKIVYLIGIGGIGMSALARYFNHLGCKVYGYDKTSTSLTQALTNEGVQVNYSDTIDVLPDEIKDKLVHEEVLIIYTPAIPADHVQLNFIRDKGYRLYKRSEVLGEITRFIPGIAVAGTHGKTTTSTLVAHVLKQAGVQLNAFLGGIAGNYNTNLLLAEKAVCTVVEADEYDRSFLRLFPHIAVVTSMDADHLDIYGSADEVVKCYNQFTGQIQPNGCLIHKYGLELSTNAKKYSYGFDERADYYAHNITINKGQYCFDLRTPQTVIRGIEMGLPGRHNVENATAAFAVGLQYGLTSEQVAQGLWSFKGPKRRFEYILKTDDIVQIDDYAHHPEELKACINSVKEMFKGKKILGVFQPHLYSRTRDFAKEFAASLDLLDITVLLEIYPAREQPIPGVNSKMLMDLMRNKEVYLISKQELAEFVKSKQADVVLTMGAGDIDQLVEPIKEKLLS